MKKAWTLIILLVFGLSKVTALPPDTRSLETNFAQPPDSARPWVYWFWNNGNVTKEGITADLEAMKKVGIGGVLLMDVAEQPAAPAGPATFMGPLWQELFQFTLTEAHRLGLEVNMTNGPGWCGSSGPWITPELSMQMLVASDTAVEGPIHFDGVLPQPILFNKKGKPVPNPQGYYVDVNVLAIPDLGAGDVPSDQIVDLTSKLDPHGKLEWDVPAGKWKIERIGHVSTGATTRPPVVDGNGLECDKLSKEAMDVQFAGMMAKLIDAAGPLAGQTLVATHIDSWEDGNQNWTPHFREEFQKRRGYDPLPFLPDITSKLNIGGKAQADRFRWDFSQTIGELLTENYSGHIAELAHQHGLRFTLEGYNLPFGDEENYTSKADEPMTEFWTLPSRFDTKTTLLKAHQMASVSHVYGHTVTGAEAFTSDDKEEWKQYPATLKALGDFEFCKGVTRFVFHRYAHQPYLDRYPGATMGPWGLHYERTNTWWDMSLPWHEYVARCSFMLRQGLFAADILYVRPEIPHQTYFTPNPVLPPGYDYDEASAQAIMERASVKDGRIVLPDGMSYRLLVLPNSITMTPAFLQKVRDLVAAGATVSGIPPKTSPSLTNFPQCDQDVANLAKELWGDCNGKTITHHAYGKGTVYCGQDLASILKELQTPPDFTSNVNVNWIHRHLDGAEIYFVANPDTKDLMANCMFRVAGMRAEAWNPEDGTFSSLTPTNTDAISTNLQLHLGPSGSTFIVFRTPDVISKNLTMPLGDTQLAGTITGPWEVHFAPKWGAPEMTKFEQLISWSDSTEEGIKFFSGTATYLKTFIADPTWTKPRQRTALDLGDVQVMARVKLNGKDLGILWKPPYRVEITNNLKAGANALEIEVVNLWPNRMIGDSALPDAQRLTWCSWQPFTKDTQLLKSGLIGPVTVQVQRAAVAK